MSRRVTAGTTTMAGSVASPPRAPAAHAPTYFAIIMLVRIHEKQFSRNTENWDRPLATAEKSAAMAAKLLVIHES